MAKPVQAASRRGKSNQLKKAKQLVWLYFILLIFEGAFRKWFLTELSDVLLIVRDPVALLIYFKCLSSDRFTNNPWISLCIVFSALSA
ncbi:MAG: hypothetical protein MK080_12180, partial [Opitutales bacterium]|nr:hypothetical protein [Opitutales bacterium]